MSKSEFEFHEASQIFPLMGGSALEDLANDIGENGQREPCLIVGGKVIDGRNRIAACLMRGIKPKVEEIQEPADPIAFVLSLNLHRRHLTPSQASMCAARASEIYETQAKERQSHGKTAPGKTLMENFPQATGSARDQAGKAFNVSGKSVDHAKRVIEKGIPELAKAVDEGRVAVSTAAILATESQDVQLKEVNSRKRTYEKAKKPSRDIGREDAEADRRLSERFAMNTADVAITQLKSIPAKNKFRRDAFKQVSDWIFKQGKQK